MAFARLNQKLKEQRKVRLETAFIFEYMPLAPENYTKVYLAGLGFCHSDDNDLDGIALSLGMERGDVIKAFEYWHQRELVQLNLDPLSVEYLPVIPLSKQAPKFDPKKYESFNAQLHALIKNRPINENEYNEYYTIMELTGLEIEALLIIISHCIRAKKKNLSDEKEKEVDFRYIKTVAWSLVLDNYKTYECVHDRLEELELYSDDLKLLFKALKLKRNPEQSDRALLQKFKREYGFEQGVIIYVAKSLERKEIKPLDVLLQRYCQNRLTTIKEIDDYNASRETHQKLARDFMEVIGIYEPYAWAIDNFFAKWLNLGFSVDSLMAIARHATSLPYSSRSLKKINDTFIEPFSKMGVLNLDDLTTELMALNDRTSSFASSSGSKKLDFKNDTVVFKEGNKNFVSQNLSADELNKMLQELEND